MSGSKVADPSQRLAECCAASFFLFSVLWCYVDKLFVIHPQPSTCVFPGRRSQTGGEREDRAGGPSRLLRGPHPRQVARVSHRSASSSFFLFLLFSALTWKKNPQNTQITNAYSHQRDADGFEGVWMPTRPLICGFSNQIRRRVLLKECPPRFHNP